MRILITNDDGINSDGLLRLIKATEKFGEVLVVAPDQQSSGSSHSVTFRNDLFIHECEMDIEKGRSYSVSGTPVDCVRIAMDVLFDSKPDFTFVGINHGINCGADLYYSGTIAAGIESLLYGVPSICFSEDIGGICDVSDHYLPEIIESFLNKTSEHMGLCNVNFPSVTLSECNGVYNNTVIARSGNYEDHYVLEKRGLGRYVARLLAKRTTKAEPGSDLGAVLEGWISIGYIPIFI